MWAGRLRQRSFETKEGEKRTVVELEVDEVGPSLRYATAKVNKAARGSGDGGRWGWRWRLRRRTSFLTPTFFLDTGVLTWQSHPFASQRRRSASSARTR